MTFEKLSSNLNLLMAEARINANELARRTGIPASSIKKIRNNNNSNPTLSTLAPIANHFLITVSQLIGDIALPTSHQNTQKPNQYSIPIIAWDEIMDWPNKMKSDYFMLATEQSYALHSFGLRIQEENWGIFVKDAILLIDPEVKPKQHDYVLTIKNHQNDPSIKQILLEDGQVFLKSIIIENHIIPKTNEHRILGVIREYRQYYHSTGTLSSPRLRPAACPQDPERH